MRTNFECFPCFVEQALRASRMVTDDERTIKEILDRVGERFREIPMTCTPPEMGDYIYRTVREVTGVEDPYQVLKKESIRQVLSIYPFLEKMAADSDDPVLTAIKLASIGNVLDFGISRKYDLMEEIAKIEDMEFAIFHYETFREQLENSSSVLFIGDNAGETVFDKLLIETIGKPVTYVVREVPVINDATVEDAIQSGIDQAAEIISSGSSAPGTILRRCNKEFLHRFTQADLVISKGQGNYEGLSGADRQVFFLLRAKCPVIARHIGVKLNEYILKAS
ncbi:MAG: ARMT1-like domain-containing protein [Bacteroidota bacterium]